MGQALKTACCAQRSDTGDANVPPVSNTTTAKMDDLEKFDKAYDENDVESIISLLKSRHQISDLPHRLHPWASQPRTVGALAATQLAIIASEHDASTGPGQQVLSDLRNKGCIPILCEMLTDKDESVGHAALVALSFLSVENPRNCIEMQKNKIFARLVPHLMGTQDGQRAAAALICRNVFILDQTYRAEFISTGGALAMMQMLTPVTDRADPGLTRAEVCYHFEDLLMDAGSYDLLCCIA
eukprot:GHVO01014153.1.p1 GENE.GHVO01014153.1~~GHVO01014153.1.p1  ORF type:complete len:241 (+),score=39.62 GHVO01014153.1:208-930(+)